MAQIDIFIKSMVRFGARGIGLASDRKVGLIFENGLRFANQSISHQDLVSLVLEVASADGTANLRQRRPASFEYGFAGKEFSVDVQPAPSAWKVTSAPLPMVEELAERDQGDGGHRITRIHKGEHWRGCH